MANIKSQKKRNRQNERRRLRNMAVRSELKTRIKKVRAAAESGDVAQTEEAMRVAARALDKAVSKGVIHKNTAANKKSVMAKIVAQAKEAAKA